MKYTLFIVLGFLSLISASLVTQSFDQQSETDPMTGLNSIFVGIWTEAGLSAPPNEINCFDEITANLTLVTLHTMLIQLSQSNYPGAIATATAYSNNLPQSTQTCVQNDEESQAVLQAYGLANAVPSKVEAKFIEYATLHHAAFESQINSMLQDDSDSEFTDVGTGLGELVKNVMSS